MNQYIKQHRIGTSIAVFALVAVPLFIFGAYFFVSSIEKNAREIYNLKIDQQVNKSLLSEISQLRDNKNLVDDKIGKLDVFLRDDTESKVALFGEIKRIAEISGNTSVVLKSIETTAARTAGDAERPQIVPYAQENVLVRVSMDGKYENFISFLNRIENFPYLSDVLSFSLVEREKKRAVSRSVLRASGQSSSDVQGGDVRDELIETQVVIAIYLDTLVTNSATGLDDEFDELDEFDFEDLDEI